MNVIDTINTPAPPPVVPERVEEKAPAPVTRDTIPKTNVREAQTGGQSLALEPRDRFTASEVPMRNALYDVTRVKRGRHYQVDAQEMYTEKTLRGERVSRKMADIPLATGRNLLHIYQQDTKP